MSNDVAFSLIGGAILVVALVLCYRLVRRDLGIRLTRLGVFVERERYDDEDEPPGDDEKTAEFRWPKPPE